MEKYYELVKLAKQNNETKIGISDEDFAKAREFCKKQPFFKLKIGRDLKYYLTWDDNDFELQTIS